MYTFRARGMWSVLTATMVLCWSAGAAMACDCGSTCHCPGGSCHCGTVTSSSDSASDSSASASSASVTSSDVAPPNSTVTVHVYDTDFSSGAAFDDPGTDPTITVGDTIHWVWDSGFHSVTAAAGQSETFDSGDLGAPTGTFDHAFTHTGVFEYYCDIHGFDAGGGHAGGMAGKITVVAAPEPASVVLMAGAALIGVVNRRRRR